MSENKYTPEPGHVSDDERGECIVFADRHTVAGTPCENFIDCNTSANARRIVACVNACAGFSTETLELIASVGGMQHKMTATAAVAEKQRDELLAATEAIAINSEECLDFDECTAMLVSIDDYHKLMEAVARAKGEQ